MGSYVPAQTVIVSSGSEASIASWISANGVRVRVRVRVGVGVRVGVRIAVRIGVGVGVGLAVGTARAAVVVAVEQPVRVVIGAIHAVAGLGSLDALVLARSEQQQARRRTDAGPHRTSGAEYTHAVRDAGPGRVTRGGQAA
jgi:hypothetical protein